MKYNSCCAELHQYQYNVYQEEFISDEFGPCFFGLQCLINLIVFSYKFVPIMSWPILINNCLILLIQKDGSLDNAFCQKARLKILRGICPVANWTKCIIECTIYAIKRITGTDPFNDSISTMYCFHCIIEQHANYYGPFKP